MKINLIFENRRGIQIDWKTEFLPSIGHKLYINDFISDEDFLKLETTEDILVVSEVIWMKEKKETYIDMFLEKQ